MPKMKHPVLRALQASNVAPLKQPEPEPRTYDELMESVGVHLSEGLRGLDKKLLELRKAAATKEGARWQGLGTSLEVLKSRTAELLELVRDLGALDTKEILQALEQQAQNLQRVTDLVESGGGAKRSVLHSAESLTLKVTGRDSNGDIQNVEVTASDTVH